MKNNIRYLSSVRKYHINENENTDRYLLGQAAASRNRAQTQAGTQPGQLPNPNAVLDMAGVEPLDPNETQNRLQDAMNQGRERAEELSRNHNKPEYVKTAVKVGASAALLGTIAYQFRQQFLQRKTNNLYNRIDNVIDRCGELDAVDRSKCLEQVRLDYEKEINDIYKECDQLPDPVDCKELVNDMLTGLWD